jgi:two-component system KDP operon response regulator KdpE
MTAEQLILAVDDEPAVLRVVKLGLSSEGFRVLGATSAEEAMSIAEAYRPDLALIDIMMPETDGFELMRQLRERVNLPIIMLTAKRSDADKVMGLELGADDYIVKPFNPDELLARVRAVLRRPPRSEGTPQVVRWRDVEIDLDRRIVRKGGVIANLTRTEWMLLQHLASNPGKIMLNTELLAKVWGPEYRDDLQYLRVWVSRVRRKLGPSLIRTFQGIGYMLPVDGDEMSEDEGAIEESEEDLAAVGALDDEEE